MLVDKNDFDEIYLTLLWAEGLKMWLTDQQTEVRTGKQNTYL